jgi:MFS family permease
MPFSPLIALRYRNFRLLWWGQLISFSGSMMQNAAILWHVSLLVPENQKGIALGLVGLMRLLPIVGFSLIAGVVADAVDRRKLMLITQTMVMVISALLAFITFRGLKVVWPIYLLSVLSASAGSFDSPARSSLMPMLVPREHLPNAISLNSFMFQVAAIVGPALAGVVIASLNVGWAYVFNTISFLSVIIALLLMRDLPPPLEKDKRDISLQAGLDGFRFVFSSPMIRSTMLLDFFATFFASANALLPIFAQDILHVGAAGYGWLSAAPSVGAMIAVTAMVPITERLERQGWVMFWSVIGYGLATIVFGLSRNFWLTFFCLALTGATDTVSAIVRNLIRQITTPDHMRGRMTSVNMVFFMGGPQLGELEAGALTNWIGAPLSVITGGIACLIVTIWIVLKTPSLLAYHADDQRLVTRGVGG